MLKQSTIIKSSSKLFDLYSEVLRVKNLVNYSVLYGLFWREILDSAGILFNHRKIFATRLPKQKREVREGKDQ